MKKDGFQVLRFNPEQDSIKELISMHKTISGNSLIAPYLIYADSKFPDYILQKVINNQSEYIYLFKVDGNVAGFCRLRILNKTIFLNNILVREKYQGHGYGNAGLNITINEIVKEHPVINTFSLNVLKSNTSALKWYESVGLKIVATDYWYEVRDSLTNANKNRNLIVEKDSNGFISIYFEGERVGSILNQSIIYTRPDFIFSVPITNFKSIAIKTNLNLRASIYNANVVYLDASYTMIGNLDSVIKNINKKNRN